MVHRNYTPEQDAEIGELYSLGLTMNELIARFGGSRDAIRRAAKRAGVPMRAQRRPHRRFTEAEVARMYEMWESGSSQTAIAIALDTAQVTVSRVLGAAGYKVEHRPKTLRGSAHGSWKGGRVVVDGYVLVRPAPTDDIGIAMADRQGYVREHRLVVAHSIRRPLTSHESVHHINGDHADNRPENLQLRQGKHGKGTVLRCLDCGSHNVEAVPLE